MLIHGTYQVNGSEVVLLVPTGVGVRGTLAGNTITDNEGKRWVKGKKTPSGQPDALPWSCLRTATGAPGHMEDAIRDAHEPWLTVRWLYTNLTTNHDSHPQGGSIVPLILREQSDISEWLDLLQAYKANGFPVTSMPANNPCRQFLKC